LSSNDFGILCDYIKNNPDSIDKVAVIRFEDTISPQTDSTKNPHRVYTGRDWKSREVFLCNGFYWIRQKRDCYSFYDTHLFGLNSEPLREGFSSIMYGPSTPVYIAGGFKEGVPECVWRYEIPKSWNNVILKYENYSNGLLHGDYIVTTSRNDTVYITRFDSIIGKNVDVHRINRSPKDTLYHTQFDNGTGYYIDYYPNGELQLEGYVKNGQPEGRWLFYIRDKDYILTGMLLMVIQDGEVESVKHFYTEEYHNSRPIVIKKRGLRLKGLFR
jgi:hypothetical protein